MNDRRFAMKIIQQCPPNTFDSVFIAGCWNLIDQSAHDLLLECLARGIQVHNAGIFCSGALVGGSHYRYTSIPSEVSTRIHAWQELCNDVGISLPVAAIAFALQHEAITHIVVGISSTHELDELLHWVSSVDQVPHSLWNKAEHANLLTKNALSMLNHGSDS